MLEMRIAVGGGGGGWRSHEVFPFSAAAGKLCSCGRSIDPLFFAPQDVKYMFGVVGIPVTEIAVAAQQQGIRYVGMRNEQAVSMDSGSPVRVND